MILQQLSNRLSKSTRVECANTLADRIKTELRSEEKQTQQYFVARTSRARYIKALPGPRHSPASQALREDLQERIKGRLSRSGVTVRVVYKYDERDEKLLQIELHAQRTSRLPGYTPQP